jgi:hypothetical protein
MKIIVAIIIILAVIVAVMFIKSKTHSGSASNSIAKRPMTLEQKLEVLASCGLKLADPFTSEDLLKSWDRKEYEKPGFDMVLVGLGMPEEQEPWRNHSVNLWHFDTECIEGHGDYKRIAQRMAELTQGALVLEQIEDYVDVENEIAWLSFTFQGQQIKFECKVDDDWVDTNIFSKFVELLGVADSSKLYIYYDLGGQDCIIGCVAKSELEKLNNHGIKFVPLT